MPKLFFFFIINVQITRNYLHVGQSRTSSRQCHDLNYFRMMILILETENLLVGDSFAFI